MNTVRPVPETEDVDELNASACGGYRLRID
jgi:hypothetical protein